MSDQWRPLPIWLKASIALMFAVMLSFAIAAVVLGRWSGAVLAWAIVIALASLFGPFKGVTKTINERLSKAQVTTLAVLPLASIWLGRFVMSGERSPILGAAVVGFAIWIAKLSIDEGWSRHPD